MLPESNAVIRSLCVPVHIPKCSAANAVLIVQCIVGFNNTTSSPMFTLPGCPERRIGGMK